MKQALLDTQAWKQLKNLVFYIKENSLVDLFATDAHRASRFSLELEGFYLDYSKNLVTLDIMDALKALAVQTKVPQGIKELTTGAHVNSTEDRPAWHTALRQAVGTRKHELPQGHLQAIEQSLEQLEHWVNKLNQGYQGATGQTIQHVIHLGIGGSDLGPRLMMEALAPYHDSELDIRFCANLDPDELDHHLKECDPHKTMFILASKSFTTLETLSNAQWAKSWLQEHLEIQEVSQHFLAVTAQVDKALEWGVPTEQCLPIWDWVGGRYSIWSCMALPAVLKIGMKNFLDFLKGGEEMDRHFIEAPLAENMPVILALLGIWHNNFLKVQNYAVLPYSHRLSLLPSYLQQLDMESNGKATQHHGDRVDYATGPILWGQAGTNGQHAFYQLLHQGTHRIPMDFILIANSDSSQHRQHDLLLANGLAQSRAFMLGQHDTEHMNAQIPGSKASNTLLMRRLDPRMLGMLMALYEHKVFVQGVIWNINSFDQPGVELGKKIARDLTQSFEDNLRQALDPSTDKLMERIKQFQSS